MWLDALDNLRQEITSSKASLTATPAPIPHAPSHQRAITQPPFTQAGRALGILNRPCHAKRAEALAHWAK